MATRRLQVILDIDTGRGTARLMESGKAMRDFGLDTKRAAENIKLAERSFGTLHSGMQRPLQSLRDYVLVLGNLRFALLNVRDLAVGWVAGLVKQAAELERLTVLMKGFSKATTEGGRNTDAQRNLREIMTLANRTGFEMSAMTNAFVKFESADLNPQIYSLRGLSQAVAKFGGDSDTLHRAAIAIQQMAGKGVISMEELRQQLGEAVPTALKTLAASLGMTVQVLVKEISKGHVAAKPALELMLRDMEITSAGAGERIANTMFGQISQLRTGLMQLSSDFTQLGQQDGFFSHIVMQLKELNATMRSGEARTAVQQLGQTMDHIGSSIGSAIRWIVEWRSEIGGVLMVAIKVWAGLKAVQIGGWFVMMAQQAIVSIRAIINGTRQMTGVSGDMARWGENLKTSIDSSRAASDAWVQRTNDRVTAARASIVVSQDEVKKLGDLQGAYSQNIRILTRQREAQMANLRTAQTLNAANIATGRSTVNSEAGIKLAQDQVNNSTRALIVNRRLLTATSAQLAEAEQMVVLAMSEEQAAMARATAAERANAISKSFMAQAAGVVTASVTLLATAVLGENTAVATATVQERLSAASKALMATAARAAGAAVSFMGTMVNLALGPIGLFIIACQTLRTWLYADADAARAATTDLQNYVGAMANVEKLKAARSRIDQLNTSLGENPNASTMDKILHTNLDPTGRSQAAQRAERDRLQSYITSQSGNANMNLGREQAEQLGYERQNYRDRLNAAGDFSTKFRAAQQDVLNGVKGAGDRLNALRDGQLAKEKTWLQQHIGGQQKLLETLSKDPIRNADRISAATGRLAGLTAQMETMGQQGASSADLVTEALNGKGGSGDGTTKAAEAAARRVGNLQGSIAGLQAQVGGDKSTNLQQFMGALAGGAFAGKSDQEIALRRHQALLKDAVIDGRAAQTAEDNYGNAIGGVMGKIAELNVEMSGAHGNLAKFNAELKTNPNKFKGWSTTEIEKYRAALEDLDATQTKVDTDKVMDKLGKDLAKATVNADALWASYKNGTVEADQKTDQLRGNFMSLIEGIQMGPEALAAFNQKVDLAVNKLREVEGILNADKLNRDTAKIRTSLIGDDNARRKADLQRELDEERKSVDAQLDAITGDTSEAVKKRLLIEQAYFNWKLAKEAEVARANEHAVVKMARDWAKLGAGIQNLMAESLSSFVDGLANGDLKFKDFATNIIKQLFKIILQATIAYGILSALGMTGGQSYGSFMKSNLSQGLSFGTHHTGGIVGQATSFKTLSPSVFADAFKYHGGGMISKLGPKEVPMIGLEGERVLTEEQQKNMGSGEAPKVTVNVINNGSQDMDADVSTHFDGKEMIVSVVLDQLQKQGRLRDAVSSIGKGK